MAKHHHTHQERVTHSRVRDIKMPYGAGTMALITLDNGFDHTKPNTLGPEGMKELAHVLKEQRERAAHGYIQAIGITGKPYILAAGADLLGIGGVTTREQAHELGRLGHEAYILLHDAGVPTFAFINGLALGGGFEVALAADYRTVSSDVGALALPETGLGLVPGWGGAYEVPRLIGIEKAIDVILRRPATNKPFKAGEIVKLGLADAKFDAADFLEQSILWAAQVVKGEVIVPRRELDDPAHVKAVTDATRRFLQATIANSRPAPYRALDLMANAVTSTREQGYAAEDEALADLIMSDEMRSSVYAFQLVSGGKKPEGAPDKKLARPVTRVGIVGAGLMAAQIALLVAQRLGVPVVMRDLDQERVDKGLGFVHSTLEKLVSRGRMTKDAAARIAASVTGTTDIQAFSHCDVVIEAVTEIMSLKKRVFAELENIVSPETILVTNTSALSVTEMSADLDHPERVVGLHFFNPVAQMPLVEVIQAAETSDVALATAFAIAAKLRKTAVLCKDRPGFVVNRLLVLTMGKVIDAIENGTPVAVADRALAPLGFPMPIFELFDLVGPAVGLHVLTSLRADLGDRFPKSPGLEQLVKDGTRVVVDAPAPGLPKPVNPEIQAVFGEPLPVGEIGRNGSPVRDADGVLDDVMTALAVEIGHMLDEGVVSKPELIDLSMILGAGWGFHTGGILPYLDRKGYSVKATGQRFLPEGIANAPA